MAQGEAHELNRWNARVRFDDEEDMRNIRHVTSACNKWSASAHCAATKRLQGRRNGRGRFRFLGSKFFRPNCSVQMSVCMSSTYDAGTAQVLGLAGGETADARGP
jgi:hypothetical protein